MRVFVAGGTGVIGRSLVPMLAAVGHQVTATTRSPGKTAQLRRRGTGYLLEAARAGGVLRFIAQSFAGWPNQPTGGPVKTEADPLDPDPPASMAQSLHAIEYLEQAVPAGVPEGLVLRSGILYGPGASDDLAEMVRRRRLPVVGGGTGIWSFTHVADAASAAAAAVLRGAPGLYNAVDDEPAPVAEWLPYLAACLGARAPWRLPAWAGRLLGGESVVHMMTQSRGSSNARARRELDWSLSYPSWRQGFAAGLSLPAAVPATRAA